MYIHAAAEQGGEDEQGGNVVVEDTFVRTKKKKVQHVRCQQSHQTVYDGVSL